MEGTIWSDLLRTLFGWLDYIIYGFVNTVYITFTNIASYSIMKNDMIEAFSERLYALIGIFMLFKLTFSLITYFIDPDKFNDSSSGFGKIIQRAVLSLVFLVLTPTIFNYAMRVQTIVIENNILANVVLGGTYGDITVSQRKNSYKTAGKKMGFTVLHAFLHPDADFVADEGKESGEEDTYKKYKKAVDASSIPQLLDLRWEEFNKGKKDGLYIFNYSWGLSTIIGIVLIWVLLTFCIDIGIRSVKIVFLQLVAPIPILSYIDPKKHDPFDKWIKECTSTYLGLFVRLIAIYFVIYIISILISDGNILTFYQYTLDQSGELKQVVVKDPDWFAGVFIIVGLLLFAKEIPELLGNLLGVKMDGNFKRNSGYLKTGLGAAVGGLAGGAVGAYMGMKKTKLDDEKPIKSSLKMLGNGFKFGASGLTGGSYRTFKNKGNIHRGLAATAEARKDVLDRDYGLKNKIKNAISDMTGEEYKGGTSDMLKSRLIEQKKLQSQYRQEYDRNNNVLANIMASDGGKNANKYANLSKQLLEARNNGNVVSYTDYLKTLYGENSTEAANITRIENSLKNQEITQEEFDTAIDSIAKYDNKVLDKDQFDNYAGTYNLTMDSKESYDKTVDEIEKLSKNVDRIKYKPK